MLEAGLDLLFPPQCAGCGVAGEIWCADCQSKTQVIHGRLCPACGKPLRYRGVCRSCASASIPLTVRSYAKYEGPLTRALLQLKYRPNRSLAAQMAAWLVQIYQREAWQVTLVVAVPLGKVRMSQRGYNQAGMIAREMAKALHLPYAPSVLKRVRETRSQVGLNASARFENVRGAFYADPREVQNEIVLIVDDLYTTGATMSACAHALLQARAKSVYGMSVARASV
jgi:ComF family protein